ncbi:hypothetical protein [Chitinophaga sp. YIM B06452]|uniref:hypothetical protein n=1 Tax=Chitinophaga sp. YIM B06452 TaxID=3082158 RepID=UPI0031FEAE87
MVKLKIRSASVAAFITLGVTLVSKADKIDSRSYTACFEEVLLQNAAGTSYYTPTINDVCQDVISDISNNQTHYLSKNPVTGSNIKKARSYPGTIYCCVEFEWDSSTPKTVPNTSPNGAVSGKYKIANIRCR